MPKKIQRLTDLPAYDDDDLLMVVAETPRNSHYKYDYDPKGGYFELKFALPEGMTFPYDFGFIPSTLGEDERPLGRAGADGFSHGGGLCDQNALAWRHRGEATRPKIQEDEAQRPLDCCGKGYARL